MTEREREENINIADIYAPTLGCIMLTVLMCTFTVIELLIYLTKLVLSGYTVTNKINSSG
jgi:hypothetical protein